MIGGAYHTFEGASCNSWFLAHSSEHPKQQGMLILSLYSKYLRQTQHMVGGVYSVQQSCSVAGVLVVAIAVAMLATLYMSSFPHLLGLPLLAAIL